MFRLDQIIEESTAKLLEAIAAKEPKVMERLLELIARLDSRGGKFLTTTFNENALKLVDQYIKSVLVDLRINDDIFEFVKTFDDAAAYALDIQRRLNGINANDTILTKWRNYQITSTVNNLVGNGLEQRFTQPVTKILAQAVYSEGSLSDVLKSVREYAETNDTSKGGLLSHYTQVSRDAVGQYAGSVHKIVANKYGLDALEYVGSLVKDSRPQCERWVDMQTIALKDLKKEIAWASKYGSGLIPGTTPDNFTLYRGGYNCRHEVIPTRSKKSKR